MIELPAGVTPDGAEPSTVDFGGVLRPSTGAKLLRVNRKGKRFRVAFTLPVTTPDAARRTIARLLAAEEEGLRLPYPLLGVDQGLPGAPVVDGAGQSGTTINLRGLTPSYAAREGYWLSIVDAGGQHYLHNVRASGAVASSGGTIALPIKPQLRVPYADGAVVHLAKPMIEGLIDGIGWRLSVDRVIDGIAFTIEEAA